MKKQSVHYINVDNAKVGQRIDNYLITYLKNVPKTHIYRILRKGEVRVNKKRIKPAYRLQENDQIRLPPLELEVKKTDKPSASLLTLLSNRILYEDKNVLVVNKPAGIPVHGGNQVSLGLIEALRHLYPKLTELELVHRLDKDTSGCLIIAKKRSALRKLHALFREGHIQKIYWALTQGRWQPADLTVSVNLRKNILANGERIVKVVETEGKASCTRFKVLQTFKQATLVEALLETGRTHQIRVHAAFRQHPIAGDEKYGDRQFNQSLRQLGLKRLFLHAYSLEWQLSAEEEIIRVHAPLDAELNDFLNHLPQNATK